jgi:hypothetical protein
MTRGNAAVLKVFGVAILSLIALLASCLFTLLSICGGWKERDMVPFTLGSLAVAVSAVVGTGALVRSLGRASRSASAAPGADAAAIASAPAPRDPAAEAGPLLHLRAAVAARVVLSLAVTVLWQLRAGRTESDARYLGAALAAFVVHQLPLAWVLWAIRERLQRFAIWLALTYSVAGIAWTLWGLATYWRHAGGAGAAYLAPTLAGLVVDMGIVVTAWRARGAMPDEADADRAVGACVAAFVYTAAAASLTTALFTYVSRHRP